MAIYDDRVGVRVPLRSREEVQRERFAAIHDEVTGLVMAYGHDQMSVCRARILVASIEKILFDKWQEIEDSQVVPASK